MGDSESLWILLEGQDEWLGFLTGAIARPLPQYPGFRLVNRNVGMEIASASVVPNLTSRPSLHPLNLRVEFVIGSMCGEVPPEQVCRL
jgi:hypothetical protein